MSIDLSVISNARDENERLKLIEQGVAESQADGTLFLSDMLAGLDVGGSSVIEYLGKQDKNNAQNDIERYRYKIFCMRTEWGESLKEGDKVQVKTRLHKRDAKGILLNYEYEMSSRIAGVFQKNYYNIKEYTVDSKGCISVPFSVAVQLLNLNGVHSRSGMPFTTKPELSSEPVNYPGGGKKHVWYWRYKEYTNAEHKTLPDISGEDNNKNKKNTRAKKEVELNV